MFSIWFYSPITPPSYFSGRVVKLLPRRSKLSGTPAQREIIPAVILGLPAVTNLNPISFVPIRNTWPCLNGFHARHHLKTVSNLLMRGNYTVPLKTTYLIPQSQTKMAYKRVPYTASLRMIRLIMRWRQIKGIHDQYIIWHKSRLNSVLAYGKIDLFRVYLFSRAKMFVIFPTAKEKSRMKCM